MKVYAISGLGADKRVFDYLNLMPIGDFTSKADVYCV